MEDYSRQKKYYNKLRNKGFKRCSFFATDEEQRILKIILKAIRGLSSLEKLRGVDVSDDGKTITIVSG
jgi:hypothetical protein